MLALRAMGVGPGDDVVVPSFTFYASAEAIAVIGANPVFCDIDPRTFCVTPETVRAALTPHTKVVIAVHLFGNVAPVEAIAALGVPVLEDAAQAAGSRTADGRRAGALGAAATFSFFPSKNLGAFGDGGAVATARRRARGACPRCCASTARATRSRSSSSATTRASTSCRPRCCGSSCRTSTPGATAAAPPPRTTTAAGLGELAALPEPVDGCDPAWHLYVIRHERPDALAAALAGARHRLQALLRACRCTGRTAMRPWGDVELPGTDEAARTHIAIPMSPVLTREQAGEVVAAVRDADLG